MPRKFERAAVLLFLVASPLWFPALPSGFGGSLRSAVADCLSPAFQGIQAVRQGFEHLSSVVLELVSLQEENRILRLQLEALQTHEELHRDLFEENKRFRQMLGFQATAQWPVMPAEVIGRELGPWSRSLLLNKGVRDGVRQGMAVITPVGLVGRISEVSPSSSRVALLTDPHFRVMAKLSGSRISGLVTGGPPGECWVTYLPLDETFREGQLVFTGGGVSFAPPELPIGVIRKVWKDSSDMYQTARVEPTVRLGAVEEVLVVAWRPSEAIGRSDE